MDNTLLILVVVALVVFLWACMWKIFTKAGKPGWAAIVPIYNNMVAAEIGGKPSWWGLLVLIPYIGFIWGIWIWNLICKSFGKGTGFLIGIIFLPFIFLPILAFGDAKYQPLQGNEIDEIGTSEE